MAPKSKITEELLAALRADLAENPAATNLDLAERHNIGRTTIAQALIMLKTTPSTGAAPAGAEIFTELPFESLHVSSLNYRKTFSEPDIAELADSIERQGLLKPLLVRAAEDGYEVIDGGRRYRALTILHQRGQLTAPIPCKIVEADNARARVLSLLANLTSQAVPPMEEADGFAALQAEDPQTWTPKAIAFAIGKTPRFVQQRLALARNLSDTTRHLLSQKLITIEAARLLSAMPPDAQDSVLANFEEYTGAGEAIATDELRAELEEAFIPAAYALFDLAATDLPTLDDEDGLVITDPAAFWVHQNAAIEAKRAELAKLHAWVDVYPPGAPFSTWEYEDAEELPAAETGATIRALKTGRVEITTHLLRASDTAPTPAQPRHAGPGPASTSFSTQTTEPAGDESPRPSPVMVREGGPEAGRPSTPSPSTPSPPTKFHIYHAHARKTAALRDVVMLDPMLAQRLACFALLRSSQSIVKISGANHSHIAEDRIPPTPAHQAAIDKHTAKIKKHLEGGYNPKAPLAIWRHLESLRVPDLNQLFAALVALYVSTPAGYDCQLGDDPIILAIAESQDLIGKEEDHGLTLIAEDLAGLRKPTLLHLADEFGTPGINDSVAPKEIVEAMVKQSKCRTVPEHVVPTLRFADAKTIAKSLALE